MKYIRNIIKINRNKKVEIINKKLLQCFKCE